MGGAKQTETNMFNKKREMGNTTIQTTMHLLMKPGSAVNMLGIKVCLKSALLCGWGGATLVSRLPQVLSHGKGFLVETPSVDTFLSHD